jgi:predicted NBD/HSP70 family sugar kinase
MTSAVPWRVGIDVGGTRVRLIAERPGGRGTGAAERLPIVAAATPDSYQGLLAVIADLLKQAITDEPVAGAGCGLPGTNDGDRAVFIPALKWLDGQPVKADLQLLLRAPVTLAVDGHLTLLAEAAEGAARGCQSAVLVAIGTGIGGAMMVGGRIWRGHHGSAGSWGWLPDPGGHDDSRHGRFEQAASGRALDARAASVRPGLSGDALVELARARDPAAAAEVKAFAVTAGRGLAAIASVIDPEVVLIGGGLSAAMDMLGPAIAASVAEFGSPAGRLVPVKAAALGPAAGSIGALRVAYGGENVWL